MPRGSAQETGAVVVAVRDPILASSLELTLVAGGFPTIVHDPDRGLEDLALEQTAVLVVGPQMLTSNPLLFVDGLRARSWRGRVILMTGDGEKLRRVFEDDDGVTVLEMPFVGADLIATIRKTDRRR